MKIFLFSMIFVLLISCNSSTGNKTGNLTGIVQLENQQDHSGIVVAVYELVELDPEIVAINQEYPQIGVQINQQTEFDHRFQTPIKTGETDSNGEFTISNITEGTYNIIVIKNGWGFSYVYEVNINDGNNQLADFLRSINRQSDINLYPEVILSNIVDEDLIFETDHHYIIEDDVDFLIGTTLVVEPGAFIRIEPGKNINILGNLSLSGEIDNMFWFTSNDGINESLTERDSIEYFNQIEILPMAILNDELISWGRFDRGNFCLVNHLDATVIQNCTFQFCRAGFYSINNNSSYTSNLLSRDSYSSSNGGVYYSRVLNGVIESSIFFNSYNGIQVKDGFDGLIENNMIKNNQNGIELWQCVGQIFNNELTDNSISDIAFTGNHEPHPGSLEIMYNNFNSESGIINFQQHETVYNQYGQRDIIHNNFLNSDWFFYIYGFTMEGEVNASQNYFLNCNTEFEIEEKIFDQNDIPALADIVVTGFYSNPINNTGIRR